MPLADGAGPDEIAFMKKDVPPPVLFLIQPIGGRKYRREVASVWS